MLQVSVPSPFHLSSVRMFCVHKSVVSCHPPVQHVIGGLRLFPSNVKPHSFSKRQLAAIALMLDVEEKNAALSDKKKGVWVRKCFRSRSQKAST